MNEGIKDVLHLTALGKEQTYIMNYEVFNENLFSSLLNIKHFRYSHIELTG